MASKKQKKYNIARNQTIAGYVFLLPNLIGFTVFTLFPVAAALVISFTNWDGFNNAEFIGIKNYLKLFKDSRFLTSFGNNIYFTGLSVPLTIIFSLAIAIGLNRKMRGIIALRAVYFLPYISSVVAVAVVWQALYHPDFGPINSFLRFVGIANPPKWLASTEWAMPAVIFMSVWRNMGYYMILFLAGLQGVPVHLYEAVELDGANSWQKFRHVTLPMLSPTMFFVTIMSIINSFKVFDQIYVMTEGGPGMSTSVLVYNIYYEAFQKYNLGYASSMSYMFFMLILIITLVQFKGQEKWVNYM
jgi:multiple sugar transport system permease protein